MFILTKQNLKNNNIFFKINIFNLKYNLVSLNIIFNNNIKNKNIYYK